LCVELQCQADGDVCGDHADCHRVADNDYKCVCHVGYQKKTPGDDHSLCDGT